MTSAARDGGEMKKRIGLGTKMILCFIVAIVGSILICGVLTYSKSKSVFNENMKLSSEQTLESALSSLQTYERRSVFQSIC